MLILSLTVLAVVDPKAALREEESCQSSLSQHFNSFSGFYLNLFWSLLVVSFHHRIFVLKELVNFVLSNLGGIVSILVKTSFNF